MNSHLLSLLALLALEQAVVAQDNWPDALKTMPLAPSGILLNRSNAIPILIESFRSNSVVKALVVLPAVTDDFYLIHRDQPPLNLRASNLLEAITTLTNKTSVRVCFMPPFLLLHLDRDALKPEVIVQHAQTGDRLAQTRSRIHVEFRDTPWDRLEPALTRDLRLAVKPSGDSAEGGHFYRANLAGWHLTDQELLQAVALASRTRLMIQRNRIVFEPDPRALRGN